MAFTTVVTHATGDVFPASDWNTYVRDDIAWLHGRLDPIASGTKTTTVTTTGITFATGTDLLASALSFTADGASAYLLVVTARGWNNNTGGDSAALNINLDGADGGQFAQSGSATAGVGPGVFAGGYILPPAAGAHTVNARLLSNVGGTSTVVAGIGGATHDEPIWVGVLAI